MTEVTSADYSKQGYHEIPKIAYTTPINWLILSDNKIREVPESIKELKTLSRLALNDNRIEEIHPGIGSLVGLTWIDLTRNRLRTLPDEMANLKRVSGLGLSENNFSEIPKCIFKMTNLRKFGFFSNKIRAIPKDIRFLINLIKIDLSNNEITSLPDEFCELKNLNWLNLSNNKLQKLPDGINNLVRLEELGLGANNLTELPDMSNLKKLRILPVFKNQLTRVNQSIARLSSIEKLDFSDNNITEFPGHVIGIQSLRYLNLKSNKISKIDPSTFKNRISSVSIIDVSDNLLSCIPLKFFKTFSNVTVIRVGENPFVYHESRPAPNPGLTELCYNICLNMQYKCESWIRKRYPDVKSCDACSKLFTTQPHLGYSLSSVGDGSTFVVEKMLCSYSCYRNEYK
ncbi:leucine repeat-rich protein [Encephalitozoon hellem]|nr:leucine repeat-rich protein [Encephalitozoon hellem]